MIINGKSHGILVKNYKMFQPQKGLFQLIAIQNRSNLLKALLGPECLAVLNKCTM